MNAVQNTSSITQASLCQNDAFHVWDSWSNTASSQSWRIYEQVLVTASYLYVCHWRRNNMSPFLGCTPGKFKRVLSIKTGSIYTCKAWWSTPADDKVIIFGFSMPEWVEIQELGNEFSGNMTLGDCNDNVRLLLEFCTLLKLTITDTIFQRKASLKTTGMHHRHKRRHHIDWPSAPTKQKRRIRYQSILCAEYSIGHRLMRCILKIHFKRKLKQAAEVSWNAENRTRD